MQEKSPQDKIQQYALENEIYWAQRLRKNWLLLDKKYQIFSNRATIRNKQKYKWKIMDEYEIWSNNRHDILKVLLMNLT